MTDSAFKAKNGLIVNTALLVANTTTQRVGIGTQNPTLTLEVIGTDGIKVPVGNTGQRSGLSANGVLRYNTDLGLFEGYTVTGWGPIAGITNAAGSNTQIIFNNGSPNTYAASVNLTFDNVSNTLTTVKGAFTNVNTTGLNASVGAITQMASNTTNSNTVTSNNVVTPLITLPGGITLSNTNYGGKAATAGAADTATTAGSATTANSATTATNATNATTTFAGQGIGYFLSPSNPNAMQSYNCLFTSVGSSYTPQGGGTVYGTGTFYSATQMLTAGNMVAYYSDERFKKDLEVIKSPLEKIMSLRCVTYEPNELALSFGYKSGRQMAVIAQDVQKIDPTLVTIAPCDHDPQNPEKSLSGEEYLTVKYDRLVTLALAGVQALTEKLQRAEERIAFLEGQKFCQCDVRD